MKDEGMSSELVRSRTTRANLLTPLPRTVSTSMLRLSALIFYLGVSRVKLMPKYMHNQTKASPLGKGDGIVDNSAGGWRGPGVASSESR